MQNERIENYPGLLAMAGHAAKQGGRVVLESQVRREVGALFVAEGQPMRVVGVATREDISKQSNRPIESHWGSGFYYWVEAAD